MEIVEKKTEYSNFVFIPKNKFYNQVEVMLEDNDYSFFNIEDWDKINYQIDKIVDNIGIVFSNRFRSDELINEILEKIQTNENYNGNTILVYADDENMYELVYLDDFQKREMEKVYDETNELSSIININLEVIYNRSCIVKTNYTDGILKPSIITRDNFNDIINNIFYHDGVLVMPTGEMKEIRYTTEIPNKVIGNEFKKYKTINVLDFTLLLYTEDVGDKNELIYRLIGEEIKGRVFITLLCPISMQRIWNIKKRTIERILEILDDNILYNNITDDISKDEKVKNPFFFIKKKCI